MNASVHRHAPVLTAIEARGERVREIRYHRAEKGQEAERRVSRERHDAALQLNQQWDARLFAQGSPSPCQTQLTSLTGRPLLMACNDAGWQLILPGPAGQALERWDSRGSHWSNTFDPLLRPLAIHERTRGQPERMAQRFTYAGPQDSGDNRSGQLIRHDDNAGSRLIPFYSLTGKASGEVRRFLSVLALPDWPLAEAGRDLLLESGEGAATTVIHSPLDEVLEQTDARGHLRCWRFDQGGELAGLSLTLKDGTQLPLLQDVRYNAFAQIESQALGNGVVSHAQYDPADGRLRRLTASRPGRSRLQDLVYGYDRVGNVVSIEDLSQPVRYFANQRVDPVSLFRYDSLSQLIEATGREAAGASIGPGLPDLAPSPGDTSRLLNYRQHYRYDASGNLLSLEHHGHTPCTRRMAVAQESNHALPWNGEQAPDNPRGGFDENGNLRSLQAGQPLHWNALNQLHATRQVSRDNGFDDEEQYRYGGDGLRVRKTVSRRVAGRMQRSEVRYLPGLELRVSEGAQVAVVTVQAGHVAVCCLVWSEGQPGEITSPHVRYSIGDLIDSSVLELDGAARIISHEGYYPFGGTAWWAAQSAVEASYKVHRYSGKERDSSGLYCYGLRYYAPWLARWINPDPAGDVDGLNRYLMVGNNPVSLKDEWGLMDTPKVPAARIMDGERQQFVRERFCHEFPGPNMVGSQMQGADQQLNKFVATFEETRWTFHELFKRSSADQRFYASDVVQHQYRLAKQQYGISKKQLSVITFEDVVNVPTLRALSGKASGSPEARQSFLGDTPVGRLSQRFLGELGLQPQAVTIKPKATTRGLLKIADIHVQVNQTESEVPRPSPVANPAPQPAVMAIAEPALASAPVDTLSSHQLRFAALRAKFSAPPAYRPG